MLYSQTSRFNPLLTDPEAFSELDGSPRISADERGVTVTRTFRAKGAWSRWLLTALKGSPATGEPPDVFSSSTLPMVVCRRASVEPLSALIKKQPTSGNDYIALPSENKGPFGFLPRQSTPGTPGAETMSYEWVRVTAVYETPPPVEYASSGQYLAIQAQAFSWLGDDPQTVTPTSYSGMGVMLPQFEVAVQVHDVKTYDAMWVSKYLGAVNSESVSLMKLLDDVRGRQGLSPPRFNNDLYDMTTHAEQTLMLMGVRAPVLYDPLGKPYWDVNLMFTARPEFAPFNKFFDVTKARPGYTPAEAWREVVYNELGTNGITQAPFQPAPAMSFSELFQSFTR